jgi:hypothetical protein
MKLSDVFFGILYGGAIILIIYFILGLINKPSAPSTVVVYQDETPMYQEPVWSWYGPYNWYNTWSPWSYTGSGYYGGGYGGGRRHWGSGGSRPWGQGGRGAHGGMGGGRGGFSGGGRGGGGRSGGGGRGGGGRR